MLLVMDRTEQTSRMSTRLKLIEHDFEAQHEIVETLLNGLKEFFIDSERREVLIPEELSVPKTHRMSICPPMACYRCNL